MFQCHSVWSYQTINILKAFTFPQNMQFPSSLPWSAHKSAATPLLADTQSLSPLSPSPKPLFHLKVTTPFSFTLCLKIDAGQMLLKSKINKQKVKEQSKQQHPTPCQLKQQHRNTTESSEFIITATAKSKSWPGLSQAAREV